MLTEKLSRLSVDQKVYVNKYMDYHFESDVDALSLYKNPIYQKYTNEVVSLIAKYEVYCRDLPRDIVAIIEVVFRMIAATTLMDDDSMKEEVLLSADKCIDYLINKMHIKLIDAYVCQLNDYCKTLSKFNHKGFEIEHLGSKIGIIKYVKDRLKEVKILRKKGELAFRDFTKKTDGTLQLDDMLIPVIEESENMIIDELSQAFALAETLTSIIEDKFPDIVNNGYNTSLCSKIIMRLPDILVVIVTALLMFVLIKNWM